MLDAILDGYAPRFDAVDAAQAFDKWGCNCGPAAIAAVLGLTLDEVRPHIPDFDARRYTNPSMMYAALRSLDARFAKIGQRWPSFGLVRIQWEGPWTEPGVPIAARYRYTHWIGAADTPRGYAVFDVNCLNNGSGWASRENWISTVAPHLAALYERATGKWHVTHALSMPRDIRAVPRRAA